MGRDLRNTIAAGPLTRGTNIIVPAVIADLCAVVIYVGVGRAAHNESLSLPGFLSTSWPFLVGVGGGYLGVVLTRWPVLSLRGGVVVTGKCLIIGLVLRYGVQREGTPFPYVVVTVLVLTALMLGWRIAALTWLRRSQPSPTSLA